MTLPSRQQESQRRTGPSALPEYASGDVIDGKYRLIRKLGEGGMGSVWAAHSSALDVSVALKLLRIDTAHDDSAERLLREARAMARLADPGIVRVFDVSRTERGEPYIVMELLAGATLRRVLDAKPLDPVRAVRLLLPIVRALECAHRAGVVHRDVKPDNIVLAQGARGDLQPKLLDFGAAKLAQVESSLTTVGMVVGSPLYMSPEQARGEPVDHRTDLWSVCVVLYEAVLGDAPFRADNTHALLHAINTREIRALPAGLDPALYAIVRRGLTKDRDRRWQTARDLMLELAAWLRQQGTTEDITGTALQGRGLGRYSSLPAYAAAASEDGMKSKAMDTAVLGASFAEWQPAAGAALQSGRAGLRASIGRTLAARHKSPLFWSAVAFVFLLSLFAGVWLQRSSKPSAAAPPAASAEPAPPVGAAAPPPTAPPPAVESATTVKDMSPPASPRATPGKTAARPAPAVGASKEKSAPRTGKSLVPPRAPKPAFKNPFD